MEDLSSAEKLAIDRTKLANERTFLAYFRTAVGFIVAGLTIIKIHIFSQIDYLGEALIALGPIMILIGLYQRKKVSKRIESYYK
jgi:putative membrane protein